MSEDHAITQANEAIRQLIEKIRLVPEGNTLNIELFGELAALLSLGIGPNDKYPLANAEGVQVTLVAGARNRRYLHLDFANLQCRQYCICGVAQALTIEM